MPPIQDPKAISIVVETLYIREGRELKKARPDENGYYTMPLAVLGIPTRNKTYYDINSIVTQLNTDTYIRQMIQDGTLYGEYGHPDLSGLDNHQAMSRLVRVDEKMVSHHIKEVKTGELLESGGRILYGKIKPFGPYKDSLQDNLDNPCMNTAFSLRSIASEKPMNGLLYREIKKLITFDAVLAGGYAEASKRFSPATESMRIIAANDDHIYLAKAACECFTNSELNDIFGTKTVEIHSQTITVVPGGRSLITKSGDVRSTYHDMMQLLRG